MDYAQALAYIDSYTDYEKTPVAHAAANYDLRRVNELLAYFDNPHLKTKTVHITGTKGKGSTAAMIASVLTEAGYRTGLYTSPHLLTLRERIRINNILISEAALVEVLTRLKIAVEAVNRRATYGKITTFELLTAMAFIYFAEQEAEWQVLEVGMGGTFDATNVVKSPKVCVITSISYDHTEVLGDTLTKIAGEKAGIIKPGCVVVTSPQQNEAMVVLQRVCRERQARLIRAGQDVTWQRASFDITGQDLNVKGSMEDYSFRIPLLGEHQLSNAATAVAALEVLRKGGTSITKENIATGMAAVDWPGRFQIIGRQPLLVVDGAHNPDSALKLRQTLEQYLKVKRVILVIGASSDKDIAGMVEGLVPIVAKVVVTRARHPRAMAPERIITEFTKHHVAAEEAADVAAALFRAKELASKNGVVCVTGSLFIVAEALEIAK